MRPAVVFGGGLVLLALLGTGIGLGRAPGGVPPAAGPAPAMATAPPLPVPPVRPRPSTGLLGPLEAASIAPAVATPFGGPWDALPALEAPRGARPPAEPLAIALAQAGPPAGLTSAPSAPVAEAPSALLLLVVTAALARLRDGAGPRRSPAR